MKKIARLITLILLIMLLAYSFWYSQSWLTLCYGLALFLFGMQCIEDGLHKTAGGTLERLMANFTATPIKGLFFGLGATFILQSTTLVSLLTIAFLSTGLITLAGGIAVILGTNLGATGGIWLLALLGKSISLSPAAIPILIFGIFMGFFGNTPKALGRVMIGIALIFLGIDAIKQGFESVGNFDFTMAQSGGITEIILFCGIGLVLTILLQSSHATLILTLAGLASGQIELPQAFAIAIGSNVGSSVSTAIVGMLSSDVNGKRLALAHVIFNLITALLSLLLWWPLTQLIYGLSSWLEFDNLLQLAFFHSLFNLLGLAVFWKLQTGLATFLSRLLPEPQKQAHLAEKNDQLTSRYLQDNMLRSPDTALRAVLLETKYLTEISVEVICRLLLIDSKKLYQTITENDEKLPIVPLKENEQFLYEQQIKPLYSALLEFATKIDFDEQTLKTLTELHLLLLQLMEVVKEAKQLSINMQRVISQDNSPVQQDYVRLRQHVFQTLWLFHHYLAHIKQQQQLLTSLSVRNETLNMFRGRLLVKLRNNELRGWETSSLMNDANYVYRIDKGLAEIAKGLDNLLNHISIDQPVDLQNNNI